MFPDFDSIPHADTVYRLLEKIEPEEIEIIHVSFIKKLMRNKKFAKFLINGGYPISIDGTQKLVRNDFISEEWLERKIKSSDGSKIQQYVYIVEANLTLFNGLTIPIMSEFLHYSTDNDKGKQDCEINGFKRLASRLKKYFPRQKIIILIDALYPCEPIIKILMDYRWNFLIKLPVNKLKEINDILRENKGSMQAIPGQTRSREREQAFYWANNIPYNGSEEIIIHAVCCHERWEEICNETAETKVMHSDHKWISNVPFNIHNVCELCNLGARTRSLIEDSMNTEKNRGYSYERLFSENWNAMRCSHLLMRLAHAINAISEFTRKIKKHINKKGIRIVLDLIIETLANPWLKSQWIIEQCKKPARILF
jgi:hypothetical protein